MCIDIVILNYNCPNDTIDCINSIIKTGFKSETNIIILDNNSNDDSKNLLSSFCDKIDIVSFHWIV